MRKKVVIGFLGTSKDAGTSPERWEKWRPTVSLCAHDSFKIDHLELLLFDERHLDTLKQVTDDIAIVSPETKVASHQLPVADPWDMAEVCGALLDFSRIFKFEENCDYYVHWTTGTHMAQACLFMLTESRHFPAKLVDTLRVTDVEEFWRGRLSFIDLNLSAYDPLATRFKQYALDSEDILKSGIKTKSPVFNKVISKIEQVCLRSTKPMLLTGPTGAGKSKLAKQIYELRSVRHRISGPFVEVNCATLRGDNAMSALFGHKKGSFTGAMSDRPGLLKTADKGLLFLDEIGTLNLDEQAMLLRALESKSFMPVGYDTEITSDFQLVAGTNLDLAAEVAKGTFRSDLLARIRPWSFELPSLAERKEDIEPNLDYELDCISSEMNCRVSFNSTAREKYLRFALKAPWPENFRDFSNSVMRMATLSEGGRIVESDVESEIAELTERWSLDHVTSSTTPLVDRILPDIEADLFERAQIEVVLRAIKNTASMAEAGKILFAVSREKRTTKNDSHRVRTLLQSWGLDHQQLKADLQGIISRC